MMTLTLIAIITVISIFSFTNEHIQRGLMLNPYQFWRKKRYYQCISSGFVHKDAGHLLMNMYVLWIFWTNVEKAFTGIFTHAGYFYVLLFISGLIVSSMIDILLKKNDPNFYTLGASGGVSTVVFASIVIFPMEKLWLIFFPIMIPGYIFGLLYLLYCIYRDFHKTDTINHMAHFIGALWGILFMILTWPETIPNIIHQIYGT